MCGGFFLLFSLAASSQPFIDLENKPFDFGEKVTYEITYNWGLIWLKAGVVSFSVERGKFKNKDVFHFVGDGTTYKRYDWIYKVRDKYESYSEITTLLPFRHIRDVEEGKLYFHEQSVFNYKKDQAFMVLKKPKKPTVIDTIDLKPNTFDVLSMIYYARCMDWSKFTIDEKVPIRIYLDGAVYDSYIRYMGEEEKNVEGMGKVNCIKFKPMLIDGTIFPGGEDMTVWVTDDTAKIPVYIETPIVVGKIKVRLLRVENIYEKE